jgi:hypothetical protein
VFIENVQRFAEFVCSCDVLLEMALMLKVENSLKLVSDKRRPTVSITKSQLRS